MSDDNPHREEILTLLRRADCHYGNTLRDEEAGWSVEYAARQRNVRTDRIVDLRRIVRAVADGGRSSIKKWADHEAAVFRALLHFRGEMSEGLRRYVDAGLARLKAEFISDLKAEPLRCVTRGNNSRTKPVE